MVFNQCIRMENYLKLWKGTGKEYQTFASNNLNEYKMKNSLKPDEKKRKKEHTNDSNAVDCIPIQCIIQIFTEVTDFNASNDHLCDERSVTERWWECECKKNETTGCAVIPQDTCMGDLVKATLLKLGYPASLSSFATGYILVRKWKPLPLESICSNMKATVGEILGELTTIFSLRIQIIYPKVTILQKIKDNLLWFLIKVNQSFLRDSGCPFDMCALSKFCDQSDLIRTHVLQEPSEDAQRKFDAWLKHLQETEKAAESWKNQLQLNSFLTSSQKNNSNNHILQGDVRMLSPGLQRLESHAQESNENQDKVVSVEENLMGPGESPVLGVLEQQKHFSTPKTRVRTSFDPELELPKLHKWYMENPHPSRQQIFEYVAELNSLESRKGRKQLDTNNVLYWFKNARAAQKRTEFRKRSNVLSTEASRGNVLKIPCGKTCGVILDDQRTISDDEISVTSGSENDCNSENGKRLQVVGKWNSNGEGEAVLEMQIPSRKSKFVQSVLQMRKDKVNEHEGCSQGTVPDRDEFSGRGAASGKRDFISGTSENSSTQKENQTMNLMEKKEDEVKPSRLTEQNLINGEAKKDEIPSSKVQIRSTFPSYKENDAAGDSEFLSSYKSGFPVSPNSILNHSVIRTSQRMNSKPNTTPLFSEERRKRNRTFIDPVTEVPRLEQWFELSTHPSHNLIARYTDELNSMPYRNKFPKLEAKNVQFWFKNRRAKNKRLNYLENANN